MRSNFASFLTREAKPRKSLVEGQSGVSKICEQTFVGCERVQSSLNCCHMVFYVRFRDNSCL